MTAGTSRNLKKLLKMKKCHFKLLSTVGRFLYRAVNKRRRDVMNMKKIYAVFEGNRILRMSEDKNELVEYYLSFSEEERRSMFLAEKIVRGPREYEQSWMPCQIK